MTDQICKCCGQTLPALVGIEAVMSGGLKKIVETVRRAGRHGIQTERLFHVIYGDDPNGGPETGIKVLHVRISQANRILRQHGYEIRGEHTGNRGAYGRYILYSIEGVQHAAE